MEKLRVLTIGVMLAAGLGLCAPEAAMAGPGHAGGQGAGAKAAKSHTQSKATHQNAKKAKSSVRQGPASAKPKPTRTHLQKPSKNQQNRLPSQTKGQTRHAELPAPPSARTLG